MPAETAPPRRPTEASLAAERLRADIVAGHLAPGSRLKLAPLARELGVSRAPLREAANRLATEGLLTQADQRGFRVAEISRADLDDVTQTRQRIEALALRDAIAAGGLDWEGEVMAALHRLDRLSLSGDGAPGAPTSAEQQARFRVEHARFHAALVSACPSVHLLDFRERLYALTERYRNLALVGPPTGRDVRGEHRALAEAAVARDAERAVALLSHHLAATAAALADGLPHLFGD
jgi:DNA-binding GntR family transcriptional regulator